MLVGGSLVAEVAELQLQGQSRPARPGAVGKAQDLVDREEVVGEPGRQQQGWGTAGRRHVVGGVVVREGLDNRLRLGLVVGFAGARSRNPLGYVSLRIGAGGRQKPHGSARDEGLADRLARSRGGLRSGEYRVDNRGLLDADRGRCHGSRRDRIGEDAAVGGRRGNEVGPGDHRGSCREAEWYAGGAAPRNEASIGKHHPVGERRQHQRLPAPIAIACCRDATRVGDPLVDQSPDQLLRVAYLVADIGEVDVALGASLGAGEARLGRAARSPEPAGRVGQDRITLASPGKCIVRVRGLLRVQILVLGVAEAMDLDHQRQLGRACSRQGEGGIERYAVPRLDQPRALMDPLDVAAGRKTERLSAAGARDDDRNQAQRQDHGESGSRSHPRSLATRPCIRAVYSRS